MPGMVLGGRYQVQDKIGTGGMATVYRGLDEVLGRTVAIKTMLPQYATDPSFAARFKQEAQAAAALQSPYIVSVYDWGKDADTYYIVMEYLRGTDLKSGIKKHGALDCKKVAQIGSQIAQALSVAHKHDIIHRDIKPQNIMVQPDGNIKVMDFGIARAKNSHLTADNSVLGTAHYVSPEQTQGKELGPTTDIYSLGIVMYEAVTGQVPFQGDDAISVALKQVNEQPKPPSQLNPAVDPSLESIILKCMQKDPAARFQTADELYRTLRDYLAGRLGAVNNATAMLPAQATSKLDRGGNTSTMPRVNRTNQYRPQSATEQAAEEEAERQHKKRRNIVLGVVAGLVALIAIVAVLVNMLGTQSSMVAVPNLLNQTQDDALEQIKDAGFEVGEVDSAYDEKVEEGRVCDQSPSANREYPEGTKVNITISKGPTPAEEVTVPDLTNKPAEDVAAELAKYKLSGAVGGYENSDDVDEGNVTRTEPAAGSKAKAGDVIKYWVSQGSEEVTIPSVAGDDANSAKTRLQGSDYGFVVEVQEINSDTVDEGKVVYTTPSEGTSAKKGSTVTIFVSKGPEIKNVDVPSVLGESYKSAASTLQALNLKVTLAPGSPADGTVSNQSAYGPTPEGTTITLTTQKVSNSGNGSGTGTGGETTTGGGNGSGNGGAETENPDPNDTAGNNVMNGQ